MKRINQGYFFYKKLVKVVADIISEINPSFIYNLSVASNLFEMANNQIYTAEHLPKLSSIKSSKKQNEDLIEMLIFLTDKVLT